ncbi:MAG TPA: prepilin-type N-terminal cleavage/methylation domain-containing protein [Candidatus Acidoferrum sp.]|jgi:prepilin-type N-terminal cleavage/methylation domain-containing protein|nr:prepilin-type N-terminal cleavage/methylation domain-containing protein [Candidatus Acidoferrum sp.]
MKTTLRKSLPRLRAFTLVELLIVIAIIAILAAMLLPVINAAQQHAKKNQARIECDNIVNAIQAYESDYSRMPVSSAVQSSGYTNVTYGNLFNTPAGFQQIGSLINGQILTNNADVIAILLDYTNYVNGWNGPAPGVNGLTDNTNYMKNPKRTVYLSNTRASGYDPSQTGTLPRPGIGNDLVYRDPWGNPYVISMNLNEDNNVVDSFYGLTQVSSASGTAGGSGLVGLNWHPEIGSGAYALHGNVMVWSAGPDGKVDPSSMASPVSAIQGANKDNVISWQ